MAKPKPIYETALDHLDTKTLGKPKGAVCIEPIREMGALVLRADSSSKLQKNLEANGVSLPETLSCRGNLRSVCILWISPDEYLLLGTARRINTTHKKLESAIKGSHAAVIDSSGTYSLLRLSGVHMLSTLEKLVNYDMRHTFPPHKVISTLAGSAPVILFRQNKVGEIYMLVRFSFSRYVYTALAHAAKEYV